MAPNPDPYAPPRADLGSVTAPAEKGSAFKAVLFGVLADLAFNLVIGIVAVVLYGAFVISTGSSPDEIGKLVDDPADDSPFTIATLCIAGLGSALGGYVCARVAKHSEYRLAAILIAAALVFGWLLGGDELSGAVVLASLVITVAATLFGTWLGVLRNRGAG